MSDATTRLVAAAAVVSLAGCSYLYKNPAEDLTPGEVGGRTVAGVQLSIDGVAISVKGARLDSTSRASGHFAMLPLPVGRHTLMFRKGKERALLRDVEIAWGKDGQPQGVWMGDVQVPASVGIQGECSIPGGVALGDNAIALDEVSGATVPVRAGPTGTFTFDGLSIGEHRIKVYASDAGGNTYVGGPAAVTFLPTDAGIQKTLTPFSLHAASAAPAATASVTLRFGVAGSIPGLELSDLEVTGLEQPVAFQSNGFAQVDVREGLWTVGIELPGTVTGVSPPPLVSFVAVAGDTIDLGTLYAVTDSAQVKAALGCHTDADCAPGTCASGGLCIDWTPPAAAPANVPFCGSDQSIRGCTAGLPIGTAQPPTMTCVAAGAETIGVACGSCCTPDGMAVVCGEPGAGGCPVLPAAGLGNVALDVPVTGSGGFNYTQGTYLQGFEFTANRAISVTQLGAYDSNYSALPGGAETFAPAVVGLYDLTTHALLGSVAIQASDPVTGVFHYAPLATPVTLNTTDSYAVVWVSSTNHYIASPTLVLSNVSSAINYLAFAGHGSGGLTTTSTLLEPDFLYSLAANGLSALNYDLGPNFMFTN